MNYRIVINAAMIVFAAVFSLKSASQTFRISISGHGEGHATFIEVYEYDYVEEKPEFPGGGQRLLKYINETRCYPSEAYEMGIEGRVTCSFIVNPDGSIGNIRVLKGVEPSLNREAVRIISQMPAWTPGKFAGEAVPVRVICPVPFRR